MEKQVYITVLTNDKYIRGVKALKKSLRKVYSEHDLVILVPDNIQQEIKHLLIENKVLDEHCYLCVQPSFSIAFPEEIVFGNHYWHNTFFKLQVAKMTCFEKVILLDSDMMILQNIDHLFNANHYSASIAGKAVNPEYTTFNSGLMVLNPSVQFYNKLIESIEPAMIRRYKLGYEIGDQDVFQEAFPEWSDRKDLHLSETYNSFWKDIETICKVNGIDKKSIQVVHFIGKEKPWTHGVVTKENIKYSLHLIKKGNIWRLITYIRYLYYSL